jgi:tetratricopeptide (TPR) repeat protein
MLRSLLTLLALGVVVVAGCVSAESHMIQGDTLFLRGKYIEALDAYQLAHLADPLIPGIDDKIKKAQIRLNLQLGDTAVQRGQWQNAERYYAEVRTIDYENPEVDKRLAKMATRRANSHFKKGQDLLGRGNPFDAIGKFEQALTFDADHPRASEALERAHQQKEEREGEAEDEFQTGMLALSNEELEDASQHFSTALNINPHHPRAKSKLTRARSRLADALMAEGDEALSRHDWPLAVDMYRQGSRQQSEAPWTQTASRQGSMRSTCRATHRGRQLCIRSGRLAYRLRKVQSSQ